MLRRWMCGRPGGGGVSCALMVGSLCCGLGRAQGVALPLLPTSVAYDAAGNLYFADTNRHEVYESTVGGVLTVVAGDGVQGFRGDGGAATSAELNGPQGVAVGADGSLYIADTGNERIRVVRSGVMSTFAGNGDAGFGGDGGAATSAMFRGPNAVAIDATGAVLVSDAGNERVRRISGGLISTVVGNGAQGFSGDGGQAVAAQIDTPMGLAVGPDGRVFVADSHNDRIRVVGMDGRIGTYAGSGVRGLAGDGGPATAAELSLPRGLVVTAGGAVIFADSNNQRIRRVDASGMITTIAGNGVQGAAVDGGTAGAMALNEPRGVGMSGFGAVVYADALNKMVRESVAGGGVYAPAGLSQGRSSKIVLNVGVNGGQVNATASVSGSAGAPQGEVELLDGGTVLAQGMVAGGTVTFAPQAVSAGTHVFSAVYLGDGLNPAATSAAVSSDVGTMVVTATAAPQSAAYGGVVPALTGTLSGVQPADVGNVTAVFTTTADAMSPPGNYPIVATLTGSASSRYSVVLGAASGSVRIVPAASVTVEQPVGQSSYAGLPLLLTANVSSTTRGVPTGVVQFMEGSTVVATGPVVQGVASGTYLLPAAGMHSIVARYGGDADFNASTSMVQTAMVGAIPDFTMGATGNTTQSVAAGQMGTFAVLVGAQGGAFTGAVDLSTSGLPAGATATFAPPQVVPGTSVVNVVMSVQTSAAVARARMWGRYGGVVLSGLLLPWMFVRRRRRGTLRWVAMGAVVVVLGGVSGCGARTLSTAVPIGKTYTVTVKGTATNLVGAVVSHSTQVTLVVD